MSNILLSIIIPTRNRQVYAANVVKHILEFTNINFELVIQDNSDTDNLNDLLELYRNDSRLNYNYHKETLSFVDNFSKGIENCKGEYVTIIGDDDGICKGIFDVVEWCKINDIKALSPSLSLVYFWPNSQVNFADKDGMLIINDISCKMKVTNPKKELEKFMNNGCYNYLNYNLAKVYHGIVKRTVLEEVKVKTGNYIGGLSPDIYLSISVSTLLDEVVVIDYPLTISGICKKSGSSDSATGRHTGNLDDAPHFVGHQNYIWSEHVPPFYCVETIWADSAIAAIIDMQEKRYLKLFNSYLQGSYCLKFHKQFKDLILNHYYKKDSQIKVSLLFFKNKIKLNFYSIHLFVEEFLIKINKKNRKVYKGISDIGVASLKSNEHFKSYRIVLQKLDSLKPKSKN